MIVSHSGSPKAISHNQGVDIHCAFKGRPRPQITWYKDDEPIINESESLSHEELEKSGEDGTLITSTTLHVPGREEFDGVYKCAANSRLNNSWSTSKNSKIQVIFLCKWSHIYFIYLFTCMVHSICKDQKIIIVWLVRFEVGLHEK